MEIEEKVIDNNSRLNITKHNMNKHLKELKKEMLVFDSELKFEKAAEIRDEIKKLENQELGINR